MSAKRSEKIWAKLSQHKCEIPDTSEDFLNRLHPGTSPIIKWVSSLKRFALVNTKSPLTKEYFRSMAAVTKEKHRHVTTARYAHMIHPFSTAAQWRMAIMLVLYLFVGVMDPLYATFLSTRIYNGESYGGVRVTQILINTLMMINIVVTFFVGYPVPQEREVVLEPRLVAKRYLTRHFAFDVASALHCIIPLFLTSPKHQLLVRLMVVFRLSRVVTTRQYFLVTLKLFRWSPELVECIGLVFMQIWVIHWFACYLAIIPTLCEIFGIESTQSWVESVNVVIGYDIERDLSSHYLESVIIVSTHFFAAAHSVYYTRCPYEMGFLCFVVIGGMGFTTYTVAVITQLFGTVNISDAKYDDMINQINEYSLSKKLPANTKYRMAVYYEYKFQRKFFWEKAILNSISEHLRWEIVLYSAKHLVEKVQLLRGLPRSAVGTMIALLKQEVYLPGDKLCDTTDINHGLTAFHLVNYGTMAIYLHKHNTEFGHFEDGIRRVPTIEHYVENVVDRYSEEEFRQNFRMRRQTFDVLLDKIKEQINSPVVQKGQHCLDGKIQLLFALWYFATPDCYRSICGRFGIGKATGLRSVRRVTEALREIAPAIIKWPTTRGNTQEVKDGFQQLGFPNTIGAIDGSYIPIPLPSEHGDSYICRKNFPAINLQVVCDHRMLLTHVYTGEVGSRHDAEVLKRSEVWAYLQSEEKFPDNTHLIGDKAYPCVPHLMPPYKNNGHLTQAHLNYNYLLSKARSIVERCIGLLKNRFRCLKYFDVKTMEWIPKYIVAICVIHNICITQNDLMELDPALPQDEVEEVVRDRFWQENGRQQRQMGQNKRDNIRDTLML